MPVFCKIIVYPHGMHVPYHL